jgi:hypothetical protein
MSFDIGKAQSTVNLVLIVAIVAAVGYALYKLFGSGGILSTDNPDNVDPSTGQYIGVVNSVNNAIAPASFPGGGQVIGSSETYTGAISETISHPFSTLGTIIGLDDSGGSLQ